MSPRFHGPHCGRRCRQSSNCKPASRRSRPSGRSSAMRSSMLVAGARPGRRAGRGRRDARAVPAPGQHAVLGRRRLDHPAAASRSRGHAAVMDGALRAAAPSSRRTAARCCSTPATACWRPSAPTAREDDPERAVRCGLALLAEGARSGEEVQAAHGHGGFGVRVGIHTGDVLLGGGVDADGRIRGIAVNVAARMEQTAPPGGLRISHDTYALVRGAVRGRAPGAAGGQGRRRTHPSVTWCTRRATSIRASPARGIEGVATRMVGRDAELEAILQRSPRAPRRESPARRRHGGRRGRRRQEPAALRSSQARPISRPSRAHCSRARAPPQTQSQPYGLLRDLVAGRFASATTTAWRTHEAKSSGARSAVRGRRRRRAGRGPRPPARPPDRRRLRRQPAHPRHPSTKPGRSAVVASMPRRRPCAASPPATASRSCCCSTTCTGPTTARSTS